MPFLLLALLILVGCAGPRPAVITTYDRICLPNEEITLKAQVETSDWLRRDIENEKVVFYKNGMDLGAARTIDEGIAQIPFQIEEEGFLEVEVRLESEKYKAKPTPLLVRAANPNTPFLIVDIDNTLSDISPIFMIFFENAKIPPLKGAPVVLQELSKEYTIVYLTGRDEALAPKTKEWLAQNGFPRGPVFFWDFTHTPLSKRKYKSQFIQALGRKFQLIQIGIGNSLGDAFAYTANGLGTIILLGEKEKRKAKKLPRGARVVRSWAEIQQLLP